ncbi:hypothetical protein RBB50_003855 [Rhinocladiella similis]
MGSYEAKKKILVIGFGGIGTVTAYNLEASGLAEVTGVFRSNYDVVQKDGIQMWSCDHGEIKDWRPSRVSKSVPNVGEEQGLIFDYIVVTTKNIPDVPPTVSNLITPAVTPGKTVIVLIQNGLNIEKPVIEKFPQNVVISGISRMSSTELRAATVFHQDHDTLLVGAFDNPNLDKQMQIDEAQKFVDLYSASGKPTVEHNPDVSFDRWKKLVYNASYNSVCTITGMDTTRLRFAKDPITELVLPIMMEIKSIARACGVRLAPDQEDISLAGDKIDAYFSPSMLQDSRKGNFMEFEIIVGAPLAEARRHNVPAPTLGFIYSMLKALQLRTKQNKGMLELPPMKDYGGGDIMEQFKQKGNVK